MPNKVVIASMCPWPISITRPLFAREKFYEIDVVPKGEPPKLLVIEDNVQWERRLSTQPPIPTTIAAQEIADDFIKHTSTQGPHMSPNAGPPVWQCAGEQPSAEEIAEYSERFGRYCNAVVEEADELERRRGNGEPMVPRVTQRMRDCARYMGYERNWLSVMKTDTTKRCVFCTTVIPALTVKCPQCGEVDPNMKDRYAELRKPAAPPKQEIAVSR